MNASSECFDLSINIQRIILFIEGHILTLMFVVLFKNKVLCTSTFEFFGDLYCLYQCKILFQCTSENDLFANNVYNP